MIKQVIVARRDLNMRKGKLVSQGSHASMGAILNYRTSDNRLDLPPDAQEWLDTLFTKICVYVNSEEELMNINYNAVAAGLNVKLITDSGLTEFHGVPTKTCLAIGPHDAERIDPITGHLPLL